jgi:sec-independent protein translocase protein TatA
MLIRTGNSGGTGITMGFGGISIWQLLIVLAIVITIFGATRLRGLGSDLGTAVRSFRRGLQDDEAIANDPAATTTGDRAPR